MRGYARCLFFTFFLIGIVCIAPKQGLAQDAEARTKTFNATYYVLDNGMEVVVIPATRVPAVTHMVWYKVGAADEDRGTSGIAHYMEHLMFKGSPVLGGEDLGAGEFSQIVKRLGGNDNAFTSQDYTAYFQSIPKEHLAHVMHMEAGRMQGMHLSEDDIKAERAVILEERSQRTDNNPDAQLSEHLKYVLYPNHAYNTPVIGWRNEMEKLGMQDALDFHARWYRPNNAILIVSGDVQPEEVLKLAKETYGTLPIKPLHLRTETTIPHLPGVTHVSLKDKHVKQSSVYKLIAAPSFATERDKALSLSVVADVLGGGSTSRLYQSLVVDQKIATSAGVSYDPNGLRGSTFWIYASPASGNSAEDVLKALEAEIEKISANGMSEIERDESIARLQTSSIYARDSLSGPAMIVGRALTTGSTLDEVEYWAHDLDALKLEDINKTTKDVLDGEDYRSVTGFLLPEDEVTETVEATGGSDE